MVGGQVKVSCLCCLTIKNIGGQWKTTMHWGLMTGLSPKLVWRVHGGPPSGQPNFYFFIACTEVNAYLSMKYFLKTDDSFMNFRKNWIRRWLINPIWIRKYMEIHQIPWKKNITHIGDWTYPCYWLKWKKGLHRKYKYQKYIFRWPKCKTNTNMFLM